MAAKGHAVRVQLTTMRQAEHLIAAGIGQNRAIPAHKTVQSSKPLDQIVAGAQIKMIGIRQQERVAQLRQVARLQGLDVRRGAHRCKGRHLHRAVGCAKCGTTRAPICPVNLKRELFGHISLAFGSRRLHLPDTWSRAGFPAM